MTVMMSGKTTRFSQQKFARFSVSRIGWAIAGVSPGKMLSITKPTKVTKLLLRWRQGDDAAFQQLFPLVYEELHRIAQRHMGHERPDHSFQATALVNEAYLKLVDADGVEWHDRVHFLAVSARVMRRILVDHARARRSQKRGGAAARVTFDEALLVADQPTQDFEVLDDALEALSSFDERKSRVIELRVFGGLTVEETATVLNVSPDTVLRDWRLAKAWLRGEIRRTRE